MKDQDAILNVPLSRRKKEALSAINEGKKLALMLYSKVDLYSSFRYRAFNIYQVTKNSRRWQLICFFPEEMDTVLELLPKANLFIFGRIEKWQAKYDALALAAKERGVKVLYDLDDCVCGTKYVKNMFNVVSPDRVDQEYWIATCANFELLSYSADGFIATNDYLGKILSEAHEKKPYQVIPNFLNSQQIEAAQKIKKQEHSGFTIGYFSGSHTHATDFEVVYPEIEQFLNDFPDVKLKIVGMLKLPSSAERFIKNGQIEYTEMVDFLTLQEKISEVDVNIAPLGSNVFANCKSELKFFEAGLLKVPTLASPSFAFARAITNGKNGFLCQPGEWYNILVKLYQDEKMRAEIAENAYQFALENYAPEKVLEKIERVYDFYEKS